MHYHTVRETGLEGSACCTNFWSFRNDLVSTGKSDFCQFGLCGHIYILRQHHYRAVDVFIWEHLPRRCWFGVGKLIAFRYELETGDLLTRV